ncbi:MAG: Spy/CpxP family protein refolding chaperone [Nitrospinae bacterium]|nr:Spy/CpxP family protein refolding chaperone [Nitrospinota bacterium]
MRRSWIAPVAFLCLILSGRADAARWAPAVHQPEVEPRELGVDSGRPYREDQPPPPGKKAPMDVPRPLEPNPFSHVLKHRDQLMLTEEQVTEIDRLDFEYQKRAILFDSQRSIVRLEQNRLLHSGTLDENRVLSLADELGGLYAQTVRDNAKAKLALLKLLTPEQRKTMNALFSSHR